MTDESVWVCGKAQRIRAAAARAPAEAMRQLEHFIAQPFALDVILAAEAQEAGLAQQALEIIDKHITQPYAEDIIRGIGNAHPAYVLEYSYQYIHKPYAERVILDAMETAPWIVLANEQGTNFHRLPHTETILRKAAEETARLQPELALQHVQKFADKRYAKAILLGLAHTVPEAVLQHAEKLVGTRYAKHVFLALAVAEPEDVLAYRENFAKQPEAERIIRTAEKAIAQWKREYQKDAKPVHGKHTAKLSQKPAATAGLSAL